MMARILGLSGSLRKASFNTAVLHACKDLMPQGASLDACTLHGVPLYDGDLEAAEGLPQAVQDLQAALKQADGLLLVTPEYNSGIPGVFKNALDWMSRGPEGLSLFKGKPVAVLGASPSNFGTVNAQVAWLPVLRALEMKPWFEGKLMISRAQTVIEGGKLTDPKTAERLQGFLAGYAASL